MLAAGCGSSDGGPADSTGQRTIYVSVPLRGPSAAAGEAIVNGAKLALADADSEAGGIELNAVYLDDSSGAHRRARWDPVVVAENARRATEDASTIAYIGELASGATRTSLPITNQAGILQVSPASTATDLVEDRPGSAGPLFQQSGRRSFGRVIPDLEVQQRAGAAWARRLGVKRVYATVDGADLQPAGPEQFVGPISGVPSEPLYATSSAQDPEQLPEPGREFLRAYESEYGQPADRYAAYGYEAMALVLDSIERASDPTDRGAVIDALFATTDRDSVLGTYSIDDQGNTTLRAISGYRVEDEVAVFDAALEAR